MRQLGHITLSAHPVLDPESEVGRIRLSDWLAFVASAADLEPLRQMRGRNPFTGQEVIVDLEHSFTVSSGGVPIGRLIWWDGSILVEVDGHHPTDWIGATAAALGGTFHRDGSIPPPARVPRESLRGGARVAIAVLALAILGAVAWWMLGGAWLGSRAQGRRTETSFQNTNRSRPRTNEIGSFVDPFFFTEAMKRLGLS